MAFSSQAGWVRFRWGRLDAEQVRAIFEYGVRRRATVSQVLLAALYLAAYEVLPHTNEPLPISTLIDLRRYLPSQKTSALVNFVGACSITVDSSAGRSLEDVLLQIQTQMKSQMKYLGLGNGFFCS
jgi:NRPS condensation-like uncharacterized protein